MTFSIYLEKFNKYFLQKYKINTLSKINNGKCDIWAEEVNKKFPQTQFMTTPEYYLYNCRWAVGHCWLKYRGKHYDSEATHGVKNWKNLPIFKRARETLI